MYIIGSGNLAGSPRLITRDDGSNVAYATVICHSDRPVADGQWEETGRQAFDLVIRQNASALNLDTVTQESGNIRVDFAGRLRAEAWERDGRHGTNLTVLCDQIGVSLTHEVTVTTNREGDDLS